MRVYDGDEALCHGSWTAMSESDLSDGSTDVVGKRYKPGSYAARSGVAVLLAEKSFSTAVGLGCRLSDRECWIAWGLIFI